MDIVIFGERILQQYSKSFVEKRGGRWDDKTKIKQISMISYKSKEEEEEQKWKIKDKRKWWPSMNWKTSEKLHPSSLSLSKNKSNWA
jgi:hypothetical protein